MFSISDSNSFIRQEDTSCIAYPIHLSIHDDARPAQLRAASVGGFSPGASRRTARSTVGWWCGRGKTMGHGLVRVVTLVTASNNLLQLAAVTSLHHRGSGQKLHTKLSFLRWGEQQGRSSQPHKTLICGLLHPNQPLLPMISAVKGRRFPSRLELALI